MKTVKIEVTEKQAKLIMHALDLYSRIGIGQFDFIKEHWSIQKYLWENHKEEFHEIATKELTEARNKMFDMDFGLNGSWGIHNKQADDSVRVAFDIHQVIRHEFWKQNPNRSSITVDSSIHFTSNDKDSNKIKCEII